MHWRDDYPDAIPRVPVANAVTDPFAPHPNAFVFNQDSPDAANGGWTPPTVQPLPDPSLGGLPGAARRFGWSTGLVAKTARSYGLTGRMVVAPRRLVDPVTGPVGQDNRAGRLAAGVEQQQTDYMPDSATIARLFTTRRGMRGAVNTVMGEVQ